MNAIDQTFRDLRAANEKALMPFLTAGDPHLEFTAKLIREMAGRGCRLVEVGIPYSDPIADGPVIQSSYTRALNKKIRLASILETLSETAPAVDAALLTMTSYAIIYRHGLQQYVEELKAAGCAGMIVPDLPVEESQQLAGICQQADISLVQLITPATSQERAKRIAETTTGFIYYVSVVGITGERTELPPELVDNVSWLREQTELPICIGFGISQPEHVRTLAPVADGLIVGSAIVRQIAECGEKPEYEVQAQIGDYVSELLAALKT